MEAGTHFAAKGCFIKSRYEIMQQIGLKFLKIQIKIPTFNLQTTDDQKHLSAIIF